MSSVQSKISKEILLQVRYLKYCAIFNPCLSVFYKNIIRYISHLYRPYDLYSIHTALNCKILYLLRT